MLVSVVELISILLSIESKKCSLLSYYRSSSLLSHLKKKYFSHLMLVECFHRCVDRVTYHSKMMKLCNRKWKQQCPYRAGWKSWHQTRPQTPYTILPHPNVYVGRIKLRESILILIGILHHGKKVAVYALNCRIFWIVFGVKNWRQQMVL
jgi:hypothetical protein